MLGTLIQILGPWFLVAVVLETFAVFVEQWAAERSPDEETRNHRALALLALALTIMTPGLLIVHGYVTTQTQDQTMLLLAVGAPIAGILIGAMLGAIVGAVARGEARLMRKLALPLDLLAFAAAIYAAIPTIQYLLQNGAAVPTP